jgi:hypothetical protein
MKKAFGIVAAVLLMVGLSGSALAQESAAAPAAAPAQEEGLQLKAGTMHLGGTLTFDVDMFMPKEGDSQSGFRLNVAPSLGYFVSDNIEIGGQLLFAMGFGDLYDNSDKLLGFAAFGKYYVGSGKLRPYAGVGLAMEFVMPDEGDTTKYLAINVPIGLMYSLNSHVALDLGLSFLFAMGLDDQGNTMTIPVGYLGVSAFF